MIPRKIHRIIMTCIRPNKGCQDIGTGEITEWSAAQKSVLADRAGLLLRGTTAGANAAGSSTDPQHHC